MKRTLSLAFALTLLLLTGCGVKDTSTDPAGQTTAGETTTTEAPTTEPTTTPPIETPTTPPTARAVDPSDMGKVVPNDFVVSIAGVEVELQDDPTALLAALGKPEKEREYDYQSYWIYPCIDYTYPSVCITTGRYKDGHEKISDICITDNTIMLNKGITVDSTRDDIIAAYGKPESYEEQDTGFSYTLPIGEYEYCLFFDFTSQKSGSWATYDTAQRITVNNDYFDYNHEPTV